MIVATDEECYALLEGKDTVYSVATNGTINTDDGKYSVTYYLSRIDATLNKVTVFEPANGETSGIGDIIIEKAADSIDNGYYTIDGLRFDRPAKGGIYIHNGKKIYIRK